jgi:hypothetical protein
MRRIAILIRAGHPLDKDVRKAITRLRAAGIKATEEEPNGVERSRRFIRLKRDEDTHWAAVGSVPPGFAAVSA